MDISLEVSTSIQVAVAARRVHPGSGSLGHAKDGSR